jgi:hypothetical protein
MSTIIPNFFYINGVIDTNRNVLQNLNDIATAAGCFLTYDVAIGKWSVVINNTGTSTASFTDSNIIGNISVSGTGVSELYNSVTIEYPNKNLRDATDYIDVSIDPTARFTNELDNNLNIKIDLINDSAQAQYIASAELKQSRVDKIIQFRTDFSKLELKAGALIDITSEMYGWTSKVFRITKVEEEDEDGLAISITALEYDANVYSTAGLSYRNRQKRTGIVSKRSNAATTKSDNVDFSGQLKNLLLANAVTGLLNGTAGKLFGLTTTRKTNSAGEYTGELDFQMVPAFNEGLAIPASTITGPSTVYESGTYSWTVTYACCVDDGSKIAYEITGISQADISVPLTGTITFSGRVATLTATIVADSLTEGGETFTISAGGCNTKTVSIVDAYRAAQVISLTGGGTTVEGNSRTFTLTATNVANGANIPYTISGITSDDLDTGSAGLTGNFTANWADGATGTITLIFKRDSDTGNENYTVSVASGAATASGTITDGVLVTTSRNLASITEGSSVTFTVTTVGIPSGTAVPYTITGSGVGKVTTATTGNVTVTGSPTATGTLVVSTNDNGTFESTQSITFSTGAISGYTGSTSSISVSILDNDADPQFGAGGAYQAGSTEWVSIPTAIGVYYNSVGEAVSLYVREFSNFRKAVAGEPSVSVISSASITSIGSPSVVTVSATVDVYSGVSQVGGHKILAYTAIDNIASGSSAISGTKVVKGTTVELIGYP